MGDPQDPSAPESLSQSVGKMAESSLNQNQQKGEEVPEHPQFRQQNHQEDDGPVVRGDGTVLPNRDDRPRNPKKKMWEEDVESAKFEEQQRQADEEIRGEQSAAEGEASQGQRRKRDEL